MKTEFDPVDHIGKVDGVIWPSVTQLLQEFGIVDFSRVPAEVLENKRRLGIRVHAATVMVDNCDLDEEHFNSSFPECIPYLDSYRKFREIESFEPVHKEVRLFSEKWRFHGAPDESGVIICKQGKFNVLIDYKCTWSMYDSTGAQLAGYAMLIQECFGIKINKRFGLLLKQTGNYDLVPFRDQSDFTDFQGCTYLHWQKREKYKQKNGIPKGE